MRSPPELSSDARSFSRLYTLPHVRLLEFLIKRTLHAYCFVHWHLAVLANFAKFVAVQCAGLRRVSIMR